MKKQIVINASKDRSRIAIVENDELVELYVENPDNVRTIGNVYLGQIQKVMPAIRAAFVDVGQKQDCFLHFSDLTDNLPQLLALAGEDVPGLNEPVLSLAPAKRVADDEDEPDVEDALEVEAAEPESSTKSRSRRRSRGRGRNRRGRGRGRSEEEEEQEEQGRRRLPGVIDLSSPARRPTRRRAPEPEEEDEAAVVEDAPTAEVEETPTAEVEETPAEDAPAKPSSRRRGKKAEATEEAQVSESGDGDDTAEAGEEAPSKKKKRRRRRRGGKGRNSDASGTDGETAEDAPDSTPEADAPETDSPEADPQDAEETPKPKRSRRKKADASAEPEPAAETPAADDTEETPKPKRSRRKKDAPEADAEEKADDEGQRPGDVSPTGRSRRPANPSTATEEDREEESAASGKRLPATLDLTSSASKPSRSRRSPEPSDDDSDEEPASSGRSRRSRGGRSAEAKTVDAETEDSSETSDDTSSRSRRGRSRSSSDDSKGAESKGRSRRGSRSSDDASDEKDAAGSESGNRRRSQGGRSSSNDDSSASDTSKGEDQSSGGRRGRSSSDRSSSGRSSDRNSGRSSDRSNSRSSDRSSGRSNGSQKNGPIPPNEELLRRSGKIIVKITKEAISTKGPRVSTDLSLAGRFLVLVPAADYVAVSKKIESAKERRRLRTLATSLKPDRFGVIVRTVAEGRDAKSLDTDLRLLVDKWRKIEQKLNENPEPPVLLYQDVNMVSSVIRDLFSEDYDRILVDDPKVFKNVQAYVKAVAPQMADKVELHTGRAPVFRSLGIEKQVEEAFSKRVNMRGGGYLFIETTEAMHVVDVNSGRAGRGKSQKQNLIDVNVEAAREVAKQLRLRDLGGIIVVDFIDLKYDRDRKKVTDVLKQEFAKDRAVTKLLPMSDFGLVQITRQRLRPSITANATDEDGNPLDAADAVAAAGAGEIRRQGQQAYVEPEPQPQPQSTEPAERPALAPEEASPRALSGRLRGWLDHYRQTVDEKYKRRPIVVRVHPLFGGYLRGGFPSLLMRWRLSLRGITFVLEEDATVDPLTFDVRDQKSGRTLLKKYSV